MASRDEVQKNLLCVHIFPYDLEVSNTYPLFAQSCCIECQKNDFKQKNSFPTIPKTSDDKWFQGILAHFCVAFASGCLVGSSK